jgi:AP-2 complex subunit alpha
MFLFAFFKTEKDTTIQRRAVDVLYGVCDPKNVTEVVSELLKFLERAEYTIREELVLKIALLAERHVTDYTWFVDVIIKLIRIGGDYVPDEVTCFPFHNSVCSQPISVLVLLVPHM